METQLRALQVIYAHQENLVFLVLIFFSNTFEDVTFMEVSYAASYV